MLRQINRFPTLLVLSCLIMWAGQVFAAELSGLYKASIEVADRSSEERNRAVAVGLEQVLVRVSGNSRVVENGEVRGALGNASRFMVQYGYQTRETLSPQDGKTLETVLLNVTFDEVAINQFLRRQGIAIWSASRPDIVYWGAVRVDGQRQLVGGRSQPALQALLSDQAERRGLPVLFPKYDTQDLSQVSAGDIWGMFVDPVIQASQRYDADVVVVAKMDAGEGFTRIKASVITESQQQSLDVEAENLVTAVVGLMDRLGDLLGERYAVQASLEVGQQIVLDVSDVNGLSDYARLTAYLDGLLPVRSWHLQLAQGSRHRYLIALDGTLTALEQSLRLDRKLVQMPPELVVPIDLPKAPEAQGAKEVDGMTSAVGAGDHQAESNIKVESRIPVVGSNEEQKTPVLHYRWTR